MSKKSARLQAATLPWLVPGALLLAVFLCYANVYGNGFVYDDEFLIIKNQFIRSFTSLPDIFTSSSTGGAGKVDSFYRPMQGFLYLLIFQIFDLSPIGFHFLNVLLHALNSVCLFILAKRLGVSTLIAACGAFLWSVHPVHTEAVTYMSATADPLHALFVLLGLIAFVVSVKKASGSHFFVRGIIVSCFCFIAALMSKEAAIVFPALAVVCLYFLAEGKSRWNLRTYFVTWPYWIIAFAYLAARKTILNFDESFKFYEQANVYTESWVVRFLTFLATLPNYFMLLFKPAVLHIDRSFPVYVSLQPEVLIGSFILIFLIFGVFLFPRLRMPLLGFSCLWFLAAHFPHTGVLVPMNSLFLEHWLYVPSMGLFFALVAIIAKTVRNRGYAAVVIVLLLAIPLGARTLEQNKVWESPITLYRHILKFNPKVARVHNNLAMAYSDAGRSSEAIEHYKAAIQISDDYPETHHNLALAYASLGRLDEAVSELEKAVKMNPDFYFSYEYLAKIYALRGDSARAKEYAEKYQQVRSKFVR